jgi:hypothetical protein
VFHCHAGSDGRRGRWLWGAGICGFDGEVVFRAEDLAWLCLWVTYGVWDGRHSEGLGGTRRYMQVNRMRKKYKAVDLHSIVVEVLNRWTAPGHLWIGQDLRFRFTAWSFCALHAPHALTASWPHIESKAVGRRRT